MKITTYNLIYPKKLKFFLPELDSLLMYIYFHTKSHIFFFKNKNALQKHDHFQQQWTLNVKVNILPKFQFFYTKLTFLHKIDIERNTCHFTAKSENDDNLRKKKAAPPKIIEDIFQKWLFCKIFVYTSEAHISKKLTLLK